ncbi:MAG TPA: hypothetical protein VFA10_07800 [Ktedonobacteraceae bacterium]|nr:hypothetical protein [Ktedonobacteraceae bacterium]
MKQRIISGMLVVVSAIFMVVLTACGSAGTSSNNSTAPTPITSGSHQVQVTVTDNKITSSVTTFKTGITYDFVVTNKGHAPHDFIIKERAKGSNPGPLPHDGVLYVMSSTQLTAGATRSFNYVFPITAPQTDIQFTTHLAGPGGSEGPYIPIQVVLGQR